jgi:ATP-dependent Lhr-like helicase
MMREAEELVFVLAGSAWRVKEIDWRRGLCYVEPSPAGRLPTWMGEPRLLSYELCQAVRSVLMDDEEDACWSRRARELVKMKRAELSFVRDEPMPITLDGVKLRVWTFAGGRINNTLARLLEHKLGGQVSASNIAVAVGGEAAQSTVAIRQALRELAAPGAWDEELARRLAGGCARGRLSKFRPCLSERLELLLLRDSLMDVEGTRRVLSGV